MKLDGKDGTRRIPHGSLRKIYNSKSDSEAVWKDIDVRPKAKRKARLRKAREASFIFFCEKEVCVLFVSFSVVAV
jgi:hypothetical protein